MFKFIRGNFLLSLIIAVAFLNLAPLTAFPAEEMAVVDVTSNIIEDTTWEGGKIYRLSGTKTINENVTLTIEPGAVVKFVNSGTLHVYGNLRASSTTGEAIYFTVGNDTSPGTGQAVDGTPEWNGIYIYGTGKAIFEHAQIRDANVAGIKLEGSSSTLAVYHSTFQDNEEGIHVTGGNSIIENNEFNSNKKGIKFFALSTSVGQSSIRNNNFFMDTINSIGLDIYNKSNNMSVDILGNTFSGRGLTSTVGINLSTPEDPQNRLISIMFNTFENIGKGVKINLGGHILRGNNFLSAYEGGVYFSATPAIGQIGSDTRYNYWGDRKGPTYPGEYLEGGVKIGDISLLEFEPWGTRPYEPHYDPLKVEIDYPRDGAYLIKAAEFRVSAADPNLEAITFYLDGDEIRTFEEDDFNSSGTYSCYWKIPEEAAANESYIFTVTATNHLGEQVEESLTFKYLRETPPFPELKITSPQQGSSLRGSVSVLLEAAAAEELGENGLRCLYLEIDGELAAQAAAPYTILAWEFETGSYSNGEYLLTATTADILGQETVKQISLTVDNRPQTPDQDEDDTPSDAEETDEKDTEPDDQKDTDHDNEEKFSEQDEALVAHCAAEIFKDLEPRHPALEAISFLYARGIIRGVDEDGFAPDLHLSRAQAAALLMKMPLNFKSREDQTFTGEFFRDVDRGAWFSLTVNRAAALGLVVGYENGTFRPFSPVSGAEFASLLRRLDRFLSPNGENTARNELVEIDRELENAVLGRTPGWARESTALMMRRGILGNIELQWFEPQQPLSRAEAAILLWKTCLYYKIN